MSTPDPLLTSHPGMTIRTYRVNGETGEREEVTPTREVAPEPTVPIAPLDFGACSCPRCVPGRER